MKRSRIVLVVFIAMWLIVAPTVGRVSANEQTSKTISSYWHPRVQQWGDLIVQEANSRNIDPDLIASLLWQESRGDNTAIGPVGAVGLLQIMPHEEGFTWRPTREALMNPETNLFWGTRTLATIIKQGKGDIFNSLAAYNGGWEQTMYRGPTIFATTILRDYAQAVHQRYELSDKWIAYYAVRSPDIGGPIWVADSRRSDVYRFGAGNSLPGGTTLIPDLTPTSYVAAVNDEEEELVFDVGIWIYDIEAHRWVSENGELIEAPTEPPGLRDPQLTRGATIILDESTVAESSNELEATPTTETESTATEAAVEPELTVDATSTPDPTATPEPTPEPTPEATDWYGITATRVVLHRNPEPGLINVSDVEETESPQEPLIATCEMSDLKLIAYPLDRENTINGWRVLIYAEGIGGNCVYDYAWNTEDNVQVKQATTSSTFYLSSPDRGRALVGTVLVVSGNEVARVPLYIDAPK